jgi:hypothetical protein
VKIEEAVAAVGAATQHRITRIQIEEVIARLEAVARGVGLLERSELIRIEEARPGDSYAWMTETETYVLIPEDSDEELI